VTLGALKVIGAVSCGTFVTYDFNCLLENERFVPVLVCSPFVCMCFRYVRRRRTEFITAPGANEVVPLMAAAVVTCNVTTCPSPMDVTTDQLDSNNNRGNYNWVDRRIK